MSSKTKLQYEWAAGHIRAGLGGVRLDRPERHDVARWLESLAQEGKFSRRVCPAVGPGRWKVEFTLS